MPGIGVVFDGVAGLLALVVYLVLFDVAVVDVLGGHAEGLSQRYKEMKKVDDLHPGVLFVDFLVLGPPLPRKAVDQLGNFLGHGSGVVESPFGFVLRGKTGKIDTDLFIEDLLHAENLIEFVGLGHGTFVAFARGSGRLFWRKADEECEKEPREVWTLSTVGDIHFG